jgi:hypothetical protein
VNLPHAGIVDGKATFHSESSTAPELPALPQLAVSQNFELPLWIRRLTHGDTEELFPRTPFGGSEVQYHLSGLPTCPPGGYQPKPFWEDLLRYCWLLGAVSRLPKKRDKCLCFANSARTRNQDTIYRRIFQRLLPIGVTQTYTLWVDLRKFTGNTLGPYSDSPSIAWADESWQRT